MFAWAVSLQSDRGVNRGVTNCDDAYPLGLREAIAAPLSVCADLRTRPSRPGRRCNGRFLGIFASPQDAEDAADADA
jgi:hypothetical protein